MLALVVIVLALSRQIGMLYERIAPMGALMIDQGPKVGDPSPFMTLPAIAGGEVQVGVARGKSQLLFFLSPTCPVCKKLLPILKSIRTAEQDWLDVVFASDGELPEHLAFTEVPVWPTSPMSCRANWPSLSVSASCLTRC